MGNTINFQMLETSKNFIPFYKPLYVGSVLSPGVQRYPAGRESSFLHDLTKRSLLGLKLSITNFSDACCNGSPQDNGHYLS